MSQYASVESVGRKPLKSALVFFCTCCLSPICSCLHGRKSGLGAARGAPHAVLDAGRHARSMPPDGTFPGHAHKGLFLRIIVFFMPLDPPSSRPYGLWRAFPRRKARRCAPERIPGGAAVPFAVGRHARAPRPRPPGVRTCIAFPKR